MCEKHRFAWSVSAFTDRELKLVISYILINLTILSINETQVTEFLSRIYSTWLEITIIKVVEKYRDPKDDKFLELAVTGNADFLISGDADLLSLETFRKTRILSPVEFLNKASLKYIGS